MPSLRHGAAVAALTLIASFVASQNGWAQKAAAKPAPHPPTTQVSGDRKVGLDPNLGTPVGERAVATRDDASNHELVFDSKSRNVLDEILRESNSTTMAAQDRRSIAGLNCCDFSRLKKPRYSKIYDEAESLLKKQYFDSKFLLEKHRFVVTTDDTAIHGMLDKTHGPNFIRASSESGWSSEAGIRTRFQQIRQAVGGDGRIVIVGHQEQGQVVFRRPGADYRVDIKQLRAIATEIGIELLIWSCSSAEFVAGGVSAPFRETPLISALSKSIASPPARMADFFELVVSSMDLGTKLVFDSVEMLSVQQAVARIIDKDGQEKGTVDVPSGHSSTSGTNSTPLQLAIDAEANPRAPLVPRIYRLLGDALEMSIKFGGFGLFFGLLIFVAGSLTPTTGAPSKSAAESAIDRSSPFVMLTVGGAGGLFLLSLGGWILYGLFGALQVDAARILFALLAMAIWAGVFWAYTRMLIAASG